MRRLPRGPRRIRLLADPAASAIEFSSFVGLAVAPRGISQGIGSAMVLADSVVCVSG